MHAFKLYLSFKKTKICYSNRYSLCHPPVHSTVQLAERRRSSNGPRQCSDAERFGGVLGARRRSPEVGGGDAAVRRARRAVESAGGAGNSGEAPKAAQNPKKSGKIGKTTTFKQGTQWYKELPITVAGLLPRCRWVKAGR